MLEFGYLSQPAYETAHAEPMHPRETFTETNDAPYFVDYVKKELEGTATIVGPHAGRIADFTTLDVHANKLAEKAVDDNLTDLEVNIPSFGGANKRRSWRNAWFRWSRAAARFAR